jgi:dipeptidyl aminopeptidase/acylaminoacyl peptidase
MRNALVAAATLLGGILSPSLLHAQDAQDLARRFGARPAVEDVSLSPDGSRLAFLAPSGGQGAVIQSVELAGDGTARPVYMAAGNPERLGNCEWVTSDRLICLIWGVVSSMEGPVETARLVAVNRDGGNPRTLFGGSVIDWQGGEKPEVLMGGSGVIRLDTSTLRYAPVENPFRNAADFITDGHGTVRVRGTYDVGGDGYLNDLVHYFYRRPGNKEWFRLSRRDTANNSGFVPIAVDRDKNVAYGFDKYQGRQALFTMALDGTDTTNLVLADKQVDIEGIVRFGRHRRVIGASYVTDKRHMIYFDPDITRLKESLKKALPDKSIIYILDASKDEQKLLIYASNDDDPGAYYLLDRQTRNMRPLLTVRPQLEGLKLAQMKPITYPAADGTMIPGYLTLPPGKDPRNLPAIVLPHGGPSARDEWGFDWLSQFYAAMGYAVLQPNFRGSTGYGDAWLQKNGFQSWKVAVGDVTDAGRWLVKEGIADPNRLGIVGWSFGGYAALLSGVVDPALFKAVVAIAPVTDLTKYKDQYRRTTARTVAFDFIGAGPHIREGSPAQRAAEIKVPVMLFHGAQDVNVDIAHSKLMAEKLKAAGATPRLVTWDKLDHYLIDSEARTKLLLESEAFLRQSFGR